jgi:hypothetical protein
LSEQVKSQLLFAVTSPPESERAARMIAAVSTVEGCSVCQRRGGARGGYGVSGALVDLKTAAISAAAEIAASFTSFRDDVYTPKVNALPAEDREILTKQIQVLEDTKQLPLVEKDCSDRCPRSVIRAPAQPPDS